MSQVPSSSGEDRAGGGDLVEVKVLLTREAWDALNVIAHLYGVNTTQALHQAIATELSIATSSRGRKMK
jgi:hypothetical protein